MVDSIDSEELSRCRKCDILKEGKLKKKGNSLTHSDITFEKVPLDHFVTRSKQKGFNHFFRSAKYWQTTSAKQSRSIKRKHYKGMHSLAYRPSECCQPAT